MNRIGRNGCALAVVCGLALCAAHAEQAAGPIVMVGSHAAQAQQSPTPGQSPTPSLSGVTGADDAAQDRSIHIQQELEKSRNTDRQKKLVADTERLLSLATDLKTDVDKTNKDTLSVDVIRKADEIEKLAHSVKERMKGN